MRISIITASYNSAATIADTINSVFNQTYTDKEHIVIDGASKDSTMDIVRLSPSVSSFISETDLGIYDAMNKGISLATGDVIGILNSDDIFYDNSILTQVAKVFENPNIDACYADLVYVNQFNTNKIVRYWRSRPFQVGLFKRGWMPAHPTFFVRKAVYEECGRFDLDFKLVADFELMLRFLEIYRINTVYVPTIFTRMRLGGVSNNSIRNIVKGNIEAYQACMKNHIFTLPIFPIVKVMSKIPQFFMRPKNSPLV